MCLFRDFEVLFRFWDFEIFCLNSFKFYFKIYLNFFFWFFFIRVIRLCNRRFKRRLMGGFLRKIWMEFEFVGWGVYVFGYKVFCCVGWS